MSDILSRIEEVIEERKRNPSPDSYVSKLITRGEDEILRKIGEEAVETIIAAKSEGDERLVSEAADMLFHLLVLMGCRDIPLKKLYEELEARFGKPHGVDK